MECSWKSNWLETQQHFNDWWKHEGLVFTCGIRTQADPPHENVADPGPNPAAAEYYADALYRARRNHHALVHAVFPFDNLPISSTDIGPGSLALALGSEPGFSPETVWFEPSIKDVASPESLPPLQFDANAPWWQVHEATLRACRKLGEGKYLVGCPDLVENVDILSALRDPQTLMFDMIERPAWVEEKVSEINRAFFDAYDRVYDIIRLSDGSSTFGAFSLWGPGKTVKVQCDASAMFSPEMFKQFVIPALTEQCAWLDHSMYHLDGTQCICHLDLLLGIDALDAIEWTPQAGIEEGGHPRWYDMYKRILEGGKSVQAVGVSPDQVIPLLDAVGGKGMYICCTGGDWSFTELQKLGEKVDAYR